MFRFLFFQFFTEKYKTINIFQEIEYYSKILITNLNKTNVIIKNKYLFLMKCRTSSPNFQPWLLLVQVCLFCRH